MEDLSSVVVDEAPEGECMGRSFNLIKKDLDFSDSMDIMIITETWLQEQLSIRNQNYSVTQTPFSHRRGVMIMVNKKFAMETLKVSKFRDCISVVTMGLGGIYAPTEKKSFYGYLGFVRKACMSSSGRVDVMNKIVESLHLEVVEKCRSN